MSTLTFKNFLHDLTLVPHGDTDSGKAMAGTTHSTNPYQRHGCIYFRDKITDITGGVITDAIIDGKGRIENGVPYVYAIGHTGRFYKIQVTAPAFNAPIYDVVILIGTLTTATSFTMGGTLDFFGNTEQVYIGHDNGVTVVNFDGSGEQFVGDINLWTQNVPRQGLIFGTEMFWTNGNGIAVLNLDGHITSYDRLSIAPSHEFIAKDLDINVGGTQIIIVSSNIPNKSLFSAAPNVNGTYGGISIIATWDGKASTTSSQATVISFDQTATTATGDAVYTFGYDISGGITSKLDADGLHKLVGLLFTQSPMPNASSTNANLVGWAVPEFKNGFLTYSSFIYGSLDRESASVVIRDLQFSSALPGGDILRIPWFLLVNNLGFGGNSSGYSGDVIGLGRSYTSTVEYDGVNFAYKLYAYSNVSSGTNAVNGVYETQAVMLDVGKYTPTKTTVYFEPAVGTESFTIEYIGIGGAVLSGSSHTFTPTAGDTVLDSGALTVSATPCIGIRVTNGALVTPIIHKVEITY